MNRLLITPMLLLPLVTGGCVAGMAISAAQLVADKAIPKPVANAQYRQAAISQCSGRAALYGPVHIIDVEQRSRSKMIVWGTAGVGARRKSFQCGFTKRITDFIARPIAAARS